MEAILQALSVVSLVLELKTYCHHIGTRSRSSKGFCMQQQGKPHVPKGDTSPTSLIAKHLCRLAQSAGCG